MRLLITGICGFVGHTLAHSWLAAEPGIEIIGLDNLSRPGSEANRLGLQRSGIRLHHGDLRSLRKRRISETAGPSGTARLQAPHIAQERLPGHISTRLRRTLWMPAR